MRKTSTLSFGSVYIHTALSRPHRQDVTQLRQLLIRGNFTQNVYRAGYRSTKTARIKRATKETVSWADVDQRRAAGAFSHMVRDPLFAAAVLNPAEGDGLSLAALVTRGLLLTTPAHVHLDQMNSMLTSGENTDLNNIKSYNNVSLTVVNG